MAVIVAASWAVTVTPPPVVTAALVVGPLTVASVTDESRFAERMAPVATGLALITLPPDPSVTATLLLRSAVTLAVLTAATLTKPAAARVLFNTTARVPELSPTPSRFDAGSPIRSSTGLSRMSLTSNPARLTATPRPKDRTFAAVALPSGTAALATASMVAAVTDVFVAVTVMSPATVVVTVEVSTRADTSPWVTFAANRRASSVGGFGGGGLAAVSGGGAMTALAVTTELPAAVTLIPPPAAVTVEPTTVASVSLST